MDQDVTVLTQKIDALSEQVRALTEYAEAQRRQQETWDDLQQDLAPVVNQMFKLTVKELAEIDGDFTLNDLLYLLKRLLRDAHRFTELLDRMEMVMSLVDEAQLLSKPVFSKAVQKLDELDRKGYFAFAQESAHILDRVVTEFSPEDVRALGDNVVTILSTVRNMTQPDIMALANNAVNTLHAPEPGDGDASPWALLREMNDPKVRKGLARMLRVVKTLADQPETIRQN